MKNVDKLDEDFKLAKALRYDDVVHIGDGYAVQLDDREDIKEKQCLLVRDVVYDSLLQVREIPFTENPTGDKSIDESNRAAQESVIRDVIRELPEFLEQECKKLDEIDNTKSYGGPEM